MNFDYFRIQDWMEGNSLFVMYLPREERYYIQDRLNAMLEAAGCLDHC
jgi:hypothetical protein